MEIFMVGTGGKKPLPNRHLASMFLRSDQGTGVLVDCGEGTQTSMVNLGIRASSIDAIFFTHLHLDHVGGLAGVLSELSEINRKRPLFLVGPTGTKNMLIRTIRRTGKLPYYVEVKELTNFKESFTFKGLTLEAMQVDHSTTCYAYNFIQKHKGVVLPDLAAKNGVPQRYWDKLLEFGKIVVDEKTYTSDMISGPERKSMKISYCTDTRPTNKMPAFFKGADLFICEGMYSANCTINTEDKKHMFIREAAVVAKESGVKELWLTHYCPAIAHPQYHVSEAYVEFANTLPALDGMYKSILFEKNSFEESTEDVLTEE